MAGFGQASPEKCNYYAHVTRNLSRVHFDAIYWSLFFFVIGILFAASWIYQSIMKYSESTDYERPLYDRKLKKGLVYTGGLFLVAAVALVMEVFCLLALQFCDGEDLMSLYWSTWTMLQLGSEIAVLGVVLALYHALFDIKHPKWALALGTPVLVVAGFGHVLGILFRKGARKLKVRHEERRTRSRNTSVSGFMTEKTDISTATSIRQVEDRSRANSLVRPAAANPSSSSYSPPIGATILLEIDTGGRDEDVRRWPSVVLVSNGKALIQATIRQPVDEAAFDIEAQQPSPSASRAA